MSSASRSNRQKTRLTAIMIGAIAAVLSAGVVSWLTPDGNLVVTLVPALAAGLAAFGAASWLFRRSR